MENKPCPFCGSVDLKPIHAITIHDWVILCNSCKTQGPRLSSTIEEAWEKWNNQEQIEEKDAMINWLASVLRAIDNRPGAITTKEDWIKEAQEAAKKNEY